MTDTLEGADLSPQQRRLLELMLEKKRRARQEAEDAAKAKAKALQRIPRREADEPPLLSFAQQRLWFIQQFQPGTAAYNIPSGVRLTGPLDSGLFGQALGLVVARHEVLRTTYAMVDQRPLQQVAPRLDVQLPVIDLRHHAADQREDEGQRLVDHLARAPFDLAEAPPWRAVLIRLGDDEHIFLTVMHHILSDTWTTGVFFREMAAHYQHLKDGTPLAAPELPIQYADYSVWQRRMLEGGPLEKQVSYWQDTFTDAPSVLDLPIDRPRPSVPSFRGGRITLHLPDTLTDRLKAFSGRHEATLFMTFMAGLHALLHRFTNQDDVLVGTPMANRDRVELEHLIGLFVNTLVLRSDLGDNPSFEDFLKRLRAITLEGLSNHDVPFEKVVEELDLERDTRYNPLFQVIFAFQNVPIPKLVAKGLTLERYEFRETTARLDIELDLQEMPDGFVGWLGYNSDIFDPSTAERMAQGFRRLLESVADDPTRRIAELPLLDPAERQQLLAWNTPRPLDVTQTLDTLFAARVAEHAERVAVVFEDAQLTYGELDRRARAVAVHLRRQGVGPEVPVALCFERSLDMVVAIVAVVRAGGAYVPLDPKAPTERLAFIVDDAGCPVVLTHAEARGSLPDSQAAVIDIAEVDVTKVDSTELDGADAEGSSLDGLATVSPDQLAYMIYTSGSTGRPKGSLVTHRNAVRLFQATEPWFDFGPDDVWTLFHSYAFDFSVWELWGALLYGGRLVVVPYVISRSTDEFLALLEREKVTVLNQTPTAFGQLQRAALARSTDLALRTVVFGGEALDPQTLEPWFERHGDQRPRLVNMYGITETTVHVTYRPLDAGEERIGRGSPVGIPIPDLSAHVLDRHQRPVPVGVSGELCIGGDGPARGYFGRPALTAQRFVPDPFSDRPGARLYRSGDLGRHLADGSLEHLGRIDHQVKVRGFRIELGEIESALHQQADVATAVVLVRRIGRHDQLVAWVVPRHLEDGAEPTLDVPALRSALARRLPDYMVPSAFVALGEIPLTVNGKVDTKSLPDPEQTAGPAQAAAAPQNELEQGIAEIWKKVLRVGTVGTTDSFFDIGGNSLLLAEVHEELRQDLAPQITLVDLFRYPTINALADFLSGGQGGAPAALERSLARRKGRSQSVDRDDVAIIGMGLRLPEAYTPEEYWRNLVDGVHSVRPFDREEALAAGVSPQLIDDPNYVLAEGSIGDVDTFDHTFFGYQDPAEVELIDPQQRIFLENSWEALERAGYDPKTYDGTIGILGGANISSYLFSNLYENDPMNVMSHFLTRLGILSGNQSDYMCTRIAYLLDLKGPTMAIQSACSTSLVAVHMASELLRRHECDMCLAGGAQIRVPQRMGYMYQEGGFPSPDGYCRSFDAKSQGNVHGNGSGVLLLKRLADALEDGDHIYATIKGSAVVNDGALKVGYSAPGVDGQARAAAEALQVSGVDPESIGYLEASGTATELGDPLEIEALTQAWRLSTPKTGFCPIGSVKTNIGHLDVASGAAAMIKTALMLDQKKIPASLHFESPNPAIDFDSSPFYVNAELQDFPRGETPRRAAVHAYAVGGTNAHLIFEEAPEREPSGPSRPWQLLPLSARSSDALHRATEQLHQHFESLPEGTDGSLADAAYTLQVGRRGFRHRRVALCRHRGEAIEVLRDMPADRLRTGHLRDVESRVTFLLPGTPVDGLASELYGAEAAYRDAVDHGLTLVEPTDRSAVEGLFVDGGDTAEDSAAALVTVLHAYALAQLWRQWGVAPAAVLGCGLGELSAACLSGALDLEGALNLAAARGRMLRSGVRLEVHRGAGEVTPQLSDGFHLEATLGAELCHVVGPEDGADALLDRLDDAGIDAFHLGTAPYEPADANAANANANAWGRALADAPWQAPAVPWLSSALGEWVDVPGAEALGMPVALHRALDHLADTDRPERRGPHLEVGSGDLLASTLRPRLDNSTVLASLATRDALAEGDSPATAQLLSNLGRLWLAGVDVDWPGFSQHERRHRCPLPTYPFERVRIWAEPSSEWGQLFQTPVDLDTKDSLDRWFYTPSWRRAPAAQATPDESTAMAADRPWLVFDASPDGDHPLAEALRSAGHGTLTLRPGDRLERLGDGSWTVPPGDGEAFHALIAALREESLSPAGVLHLWSLGDPDGKTSDPDSPAALDDDELRHGFWSVLHLARALADRGGELPPLVVVTRGAEEVTGGETLVPARATLEALLSTLPRELPGARCRQIDVEGAVGGRLATTLLREILADSGDTRIAYRGRHRWVADHERLDLGAGDGDTDDALETPWTRLRTDGVHMITGGTGPMALVAARCLARHGGHRLALVGESALPPRDAWDAWLDEHGEDDATGRKIAQLRQLEALGAELLLIDADLTRDGSVTQAVARVRQHFGDLHSVIHAVGEPSPEDARPIAALDEDFFQYRLRQRLEPVLTVHRALHASPNGHTAPEFHLLSTTLGGILGAPLSVADNAADAYLVAFAKAADPTGPTWLCIDWDRLDDGSASEGMGTAITVDEAEAVLARALTAPEEVLQVTVSTVDLGARRDALGQPPEEVEELEQEIRPRPDLEGPFVAPQNDTEAAIAQLWAEILFLEQVGVTDNFFDLGGNSLMATQLVSRLREDFAIDLTLKDFFEDATVQRIAQGVELAQWASGPGGEAVSDGGTVSDGGDSDSGDTGEEEFGEI